VKIALGQINPTIGDIAGNVDKILQYIGRARELGAQLVVFPELSLTGYPPRDLLERTDKKPAGDLSEREMEIVVLAARGLSNERISEELHLATTTVRRHLANVYRKIGARSRTEAVRTALTEQWIVLSEITEAAN